MLGDTITVDCGTGQASQHTLTAEEIADRLAEIERDTAAQHARLARDLATVTDREQARMRWLASELAGKPAEEVYALVESALSGAATVAQVRQVLIRLLPILAAGLVALARREMED